MSFPKYKAYKESGVEWLGEVPAHWRVIALKRELALVTEKAEQSERKIALENVQSWSGLFTESDSEFEGEGVAFRSGDLLFGKLRPYLAKVHVAGFAGAAVGDFHVMRPCSTLVSRFAFYQLIRREVISVIDGSTYGAKMPRAGWEFMASLPIVAPPTSEQTAIADFLDQSSRQHSDCARPHIAVGALAPMGGAIKTYPLWAGAWQSAVKPKRRR